MKDNTDYSPQCKLWNALPTVSLRGRRPGPLLNAVEMEDVVAALAVPHRSHDPDDLTAHHALVLLLRQLLDQAPWEEGVMRTRGN